MRIWWFVRSAIDGFFGLFVDNLLQLMLIAVLCTNVCGMPAELVYGRIVSGAAGTYGLACHCRSLSGQIQSQRK